MPKEKPTYTTNIDSGDITNILNKRTQIQNRNRYARAKARTELKERLEREIQEKTINVNLSKSKIVDIQELIDTCYSRNHCDETIIKHYTDCLEIFYNQITYNPCLIEEEEDIPSPLTQPIPAQNYFICNCVKMNRGNSSLVGINIWGCASSSKIIAILLLALIQKKITIDNLLQDSIRERNFIGSTLLKFNDPIYSEFFSGSFNTESIKKLLQNYGNYTSVSQGVNILGILFKIDGQYYSGVSPSHFFCVYMFQDMEYGIIIQSWVGNGVSPMTVTKFRIEQLNNYLDLLKTNHEREIEREKKVEIARFFNDPKANVENPNPNDVFIKDGREYHIFCMNQPFLINNFMSSTAIIDATSRGGSKRTMRTKRTRKTRRVKRKTTKSSRRTKSSKKR